MFESSGEMTPPCGGAFGRQAQATISQDSRFQPFIDHPSDDAVRHSLVEEGTQVMVRDRVEVLAYVDVQHPVLSLPRDGAEQHAQRLMRRSPGSEAMRARTKVLLVDGLEHHRNRPLT